MDMTPGDPAVAKLGVDATAAQIEELREEMGLNDPFLVRYGRFILNLVQGDLGTSYKTGLDVMQQIMQRIPYTFLLSFAALLFAVIVGIPAGIISAREIFFHSGKGNMPWNLNLKRISAGRYARHQFINYSSVYSLISARRISTLFSIPSTLMCS